MGINFKRGFEVEDRIRTRLESLGCRIDRNPVWDHKYKLDFVILNFIDNPAIYSCGVQITARLDDVDKLQEFYDLNQNGRVTQKSLYIELEDLLDLEEGGSVSVLAAILEFQFNRKHGDRKIALARIGRDLGYEFHDIPERLAQLRKAGLELLKPRPAAAADIQQLVNRFGKVEQSSPLGNGNGNSKEATGPQNEGVLDVYYRQGGNGFIKGEIETYFFHINYVVDDELRDILNGLPMQTGSTVIQLPVSYVNMGQTRPGARYKEARFVRLRHTVD